MEDFIMLFNIVCGILFIIMFIKIWIMTNNVQRIARKICSGTNNTQNSILEDENIEKIESKKTIIKQFKKDLDETYWNGGNYHEKVEALINQYKKIAKENNLEIDFMSITNTV